MSLTPAPISDHDASDLVLGVLASVDRKDADLFVSFLSEDAIFRFGNAEAVQGRAAIHAAVSGFFDSVRSLSHRVERVFAAADAVACAGTVTYVRHDGSEVSVPFADVFELQGGKIKGYLIYIDIAPLYA